MGKLKFSVTHAPGLGPKASPSPRADFSGIRQRSATTVYKTFLAFHDAAVSIGSVLLGGWLVEGSFFSGASPAQFGLLVLAGLIPVVFFKTFRGYAYHLIFTFWGHVGRLAAAFALSLLTFGIVLFAYNWSRFISPFLFAPFLIFISVLALAINRLFHDKFLLLIKALGLACILVGISGLIDTGDGPALLNHIDAFAAGIAIAIPSLTLGRIVAVQWLFNRVIRGRFRRQTLIIGSGREAESLANRILQQNAPYWIIGTVGGFCGIQLNSTAKLNLGRVEELESVLANYEVQEAVVTDETISKGDLIGLLDELTKHGISVWFMPKLMPIIDVKLYIDNFCGIPMIRLEAKRNQFFTGHCKRGTDLVLSLLGLAACTPLFIIFSLAIKLTSSGPVFYRAKAVGKGSKFFIMFKFRTMITGASKDIHKDYVARMIKGEIVPDGSGKILKIVDDPRVTRVGRFLRRTSLDELPQLVNVLRGEMSLVGPRPCLPYEFDIYKEWHKKRTRVRPGITGLWQVVGRSEVSFEDMILLDLYYIYNQSLELDFSILFETVFTLLKKKGAY